MIWYTVVSNSLKIGRTYLDAYGNPPCTLPLWSRTQSTKPQNGISFSEDPRQFILLPGNARKRYKVLLARQDEFIKASEESPYNKYTDGPNKS